MSDTLANGNQECLKKETGQNEVCLEHEQMEIKSVWKKEEEEEEEENKKQRQQQQQQKQRRCMFETWTGKYLPEA